VDLQVPPTCLSRSLTSACVGFWPNDRSSSPSDSRGTCPVPRLSKRAKASLYSGSQWRFGIEHVCELTCVTGGLFVSAGHLEGMQLTMSVDCVQMRVSDVDESRLYDQVRSVMLLH
jgi:hypothetical protein